MKVVILIAAFAALATASPRPKRGAASQTEAGPSCPGEEYLVHPISIHEFRNIMGAMITTVYGTVERLHETEKAARDLEKQPTRENFENVADLFSVYENETMTSYHHLACGVFHLAIRLYIGAVGFSDCEERCEAMTDFELGDQSGEDSHGEDSHGATVEEYLAVMGRATADDLYCYKGQLLQVEAIKTDVMTAENKYTAGHAIRLVSEFMRELYSIRSGMLTFERRVRRVLSRLTATEPPTTTELPDQRELAEKEIRMLLRQLIDKEQDSA